MIVPWWVGVVLALVVAVVVGEVVHHRRSPGRAPQRSGADDSHGGFRLDLLAGSALTLTLLLASTLAVIVDLSHPYNGISTIGPGYLAQVADSDTANYAALWAGRTVSMCDPAGRHPAR